MPDQLDPNLDQLAQQRMMTHSPEPPNPAAPWLQRAQQFAHGGLAEAFGWPDNTLSQIARSQSLRDATMFWNPLAGGMMLPVGAIPGAPRMGVGTVTRSEMPVATGNENFMQMGSEQEQSIVTFRANGLSDKYLNTVWDRVQKMTPDQMIRMNTLWNPAQEISRMVGVSPHEAYAYLANQMFQRMGVNRWMTLQEARVVMSNARSGPKIVPNPESLE